MMGSPVGHDSKQSEKEYLRRTAGGAWERLKPFSPPGTSTLGDSTALIQDFAAALRHLPPASDDLILDLGAGACWCSDWLQRLNLRTVAVDISEDMLRLGRTRLTGPQPWVVAGDLEQLPFASGTFDKAYCLSAIHHIPDIPRAVSELHRVLSPHGAVLFSEPGVGHADQAGSVTAMRDFGVLEQDIVASDFMAACTRAGFEHVALRPMSYLIPQVELTQTQWEAWARRAASKRPTRAAKAIWRGVLELVGLGKQDVLLEEALSMQLVRLLRGAMADHPVIVAAKRRPVESHGEARRAHITVIAAPSRVAAGQSDSDQDPASATPGRSRGTPTVTRRQRRCDSACNCWLVTSGCWTGTFIDTTCPARSPLGRSSTSTCRVRRRTRQGGTISSSTW